MRKNEFDPNEAMIVAVVLAFVAFLLATVYALYLPQLVAFISK